MCDRCLPRHDRRWFLRAAAGGGAALVAGTALRTDAADARPASAKTVSAPTIVPRSAWGAPSPPPIRGRAYAPIRKLIVHHTGGGQFRSNPIEAMQLVYAEMVGRRGYRDIGYNFAIDANGTIYEGRWARNYAAGEVHDGEDTDGLGVVGAHALGANAGSCGIVLIGDYSVAKPTKAMIASLTQLLAWKASRHQIDALGKDTYVTLLGTYDTFPNISGHRNVGLTICPGNGVMNVLDGIRADVRAIAGTFPAVAADNPRSVRYRNGFNPITKGDPDGDGVPGEANPEDGGSTVGQQPSTSSTTSTTSKSSSSSSNSSSSSSSSSSKTSSSTESSTSSSADDGNNSTKSTGGGNLIGYRVLAANGGLVTLGSAPKVGSPAGRGMTNTVAIAGDGTDFYVLDRGGKVAAFGAAKGLGGLDTTGDRNPAADMAASPTSNGYWIMTEPGGIWAFGAATWYGSPSKSANTAGVKSVRMHPTPSGHGYWVLGSDGRMRGYGDAVFYGSPASQGVADAVDFWPTPSGRGYWILTASGRVVSFGDASAKGDLTSRKSWAKPAVAILGAGTGYLIVTSDGGVYAYGDVPYYGSIAGSGLKPIAIAPAFE